MSGHGVMGIALGVVLCAVPALHAQLPFTAPVGQVVADSGSKTTLYAGTGGGVLKSTDSGATWVQAPVYPLGQEQPPVTALLATMSAPSSVTPNDFPLA